jgi:hypothetical protein
VDKIAKLGWEARLSSGEAVDRTIPELKAEHGF